MHVRAVPPAVSCRGLTVALRDGATILADVSLDLEPGDSVVLWGRSGAGKTTLLRTIAGLGRSARGEIEVLGRPVGDRVASRVERSRVALIPQHLGLVLERTALDNVLCGALGRLGALGGLAGFPRAVRVAARGRLARLGLGDRADVAVRHLSGGERQRVAIARALMQEPAVILADEPVAALDRARARDVLELLRDVARESGAALVTVLHDERLALEQASRLVAIEEGRIAYDGATGAYFEKRGHAHPDSLPEGEGRAEARAPDPDPDPTPRPHARPGPAPASTARRAGRLALVLAALAAVYASARFVVGASGTRWEYAVSNAFDVVGRFFPPDPSAAGTLATSLAETLAMALLGTTLSLVASVPLAFLAAANLSPAIVRVPARLLLNGLRTVPALVFGLLAVATLGLGPLSGTVALAIYATGYLGRFFYESLESLPRATQEVLHAAGASRLQVARHAAVPEAMPQLLSHVVFMLEYNIRNGSILGVVGAGGIGFYLYAYLRSFDYPKATTALAAIFVVVVLCDALGGWLRGRLRRS